MAKEMFQGTGISVTQEGKRHVGELRPSESV